MTFFASKVSTKEIVETVIRNHPKDCIFAPGAVENICTGLAMAKDETEFLDMCERLLVENEIYCPHEGIDRRHHYATEWSLGGLSG